MHKPRAVDWNDLRFFVHAVRLKTLAGAARSLAVEHSTVGRRLSELERALGAALVIRRPDGLQPTPLGEQLAPLVEEIERIVLAIQELATTRKARVRLAVPSGFSTVVSRQLSGFLRDHPGIALEIMSGSVPVDLGKGEAELALRVGPVSDKDLIARKLGEAAWSLYASDAYLARRPAPADPRHLAGHEVLGYDVRLAGTPGARWIETHGSGAVIAMRTRELSEMVAAAVAGVGLAALPCMLADGEPALRRLTREVLGSRPVSLVYRRDVLLAEPVRIVIRFVMRTMKQVLNSGTAGLPPASARREEA